MRKLIVLLAATSLAGCVNMAPPHERPSMPTASEYPSGFANDVTLGQRATEIAWRDFFADPRLEGLILQAMEHNRDLAISIAQIEEARGLYRITDADRLPTIGSSASVTSSRSMSVLSTPPEATTSERYSVGVGITSFELDFWGRVKNLSEAARSQYLATAQAERAFRLALVRDVASTYFTSRGADERIALADATVRSRKDGLRIAKLRLDAGVTSALDYRQAETLMTQAEAQLAALKLTKAQADNYLAVLIGGPVPATLPAPRPLTAQLQSPALSAGLPSDLLVARPDILASEESLRAARANVGAARAAFFPSISLTGNLGFSSASLGNLFSDNGLTWSFGPTISLPIFDFGRNKGNLTVAEARENIAIASYEKAIQSAFREVSDALAARRYLAEQVEAQERGMVATQRIAHLARLRYREGVSTYLEVLDAERNLFAAEQSLLELRRAQADNMVTLYVALGGGMVEPGQAASNAPQ